MMGMALTLRSRTIVGTYQEIWGTLTAYNLVRLEMSKAALAVKCEPTEISFIRAFHGSLAAAPAPTSRYAPE